MAPACRYRRRAVPEIREFMRRHRLKVNMAIELRFTAADRAFLSALTEGRTAALPPMPLAAWPAWQPYFRAVESLMWGYDGRPHWGKLHFQTFETLRERYRERDRFQAVRARLDPAGQFRNSYTDRVLGLPGA